MKVETKRNEMNLCRFFGQSKKRNKQNQNILNDYILIKHTK